MNKYVLLFLFCVPFAANAQANLNTDTIQWAKGLSWNQIKEKAKAESKYIFVDCYATWCGPCKKMDKDVYTNPDVANFFNEKFISVKIQMDQTDNDVDNVKAWYSDAQLLGRKYKVVAYPSFLFFAPDGRMVEMEAGYKSVEGFIKLGQSVLVPDKSYADPYKQYDSLINEYNKGNKDFSVMPYLVKTSMSIGERETAKLIGKEYLNYLLALPDNKLYTKENIEFLTSTYGIGSKSKLFRLFYPDGHKADSVMNKKGFAESIVDKTIQREEIESFTHEASSGMQIGGGTAKYPEVNWSKAYNNIKDKYGDKYADRNVLSVQIRYYRFKDPLKYIRYFIERKDKFGSDLTDADEQGEVNGCAYSIFENSDDKKQIKTAIKWMKVVVNKNSEIGNYLDTYACLLYKAGRKKAGLRWEQKAVELLSLNPKQQYPGQVESYQNKIEGMKKEKKIWVEVQ